MINDLHLSRGQSCVAILMCVRNEQAYLDLNISFHLDAGFDYIFIANHCSTDATREILDSYSSDGRVVVIEVTEAAFDHALIANELLAFAKQYYEIDWFLFLDADEFFSSVYEDVHALTSELDEQKIPYATIGWVNALFDFSYKDYTCAPTHAIDTMKFYLPWPEKPWQEHGHFRKALVRNHDRIEIVVGGHFVKSENNPEFFGDFYWNPFIVPEGQARLLHFELRDRPSSLLNKWANFSEFKTDSTSSTDAPWHERIDTIRKYAREFEGRVEEVKKRWFVEHRTFWGTLIPDERFCSDTSLVIWYRKYFRRKIEGGSVNSVCLVRDGYLGDVVMTEPVARLVKGFVSEVYLATSISNAAKLIEPYTGVVPYDEFDKFRDRCDLNIRLVYELGDNRTTYIQGYFASIGYENILSRDIPLVINNWPTPIGERFFLVAPFTSRWEEKKRSWGFAKYSRLAEELAARFNIRAIILDQSFSFEEMISLIEHCEFFIGNDSGPAVIAQSFAKRSFVLFGATSPKYLHLSANCVAIFQPLRHFLCDHLNREEEIACCEEFCMDNLRFETVLNTIDNHLRSDIDL